MRSRAFAVLLLATFAHGVTRIAVLDGRTTLGRFGDAVCGLDFNHDGVSDIAVGEPGWNRVYIYFGGVPFDTSPDLVLAGTAGTYFGSSLAPVGDLNRDGIDDLAVGAPRDNAGGAGAGRVYVYFGATTPDPDADLVFTGRAAAGRFGQAIDGGEDVNGDSAHDLLVGAPGDQHAFLFLGGNLLDTVPDLTLRNGNGDYFGGAVALPGDASQDTFGDILVGDYRHSGGILHGGGCFFYRGSSPLDPFLDQQWEGDEQNRQLGVTVCGTGDLNGDGTNDLAFGGSQTATVHLYWGGAVIGLVPDLRLGGSRRFGSWIAGQADVNGDRFGDLLVGADGDDLGVPTGPGYASLFLGGDPMGTTPDTVLAGEEDGDMFGSCVAFCGDVNGDRHEDFVVGAPGHDTRGSNAGRAYVYSSGWTDITRREPVPCVAPFRLYPGTVVRAGTALVLECGAGVDRVTVFDASGRTVQTSPGKAARSVTLRTNRAGVYSALLERGRLQTRARYAVVE